MFIVNDYVINQFMMYMVGEYDRYGKLCTRVIEAERTILVDRSPLQVLDYSICYIGYDLRGAILSSKMHLGDIPMCPIMINPIQQICLFPTKSAKHDETIWFNPSYIHRTVGFNRKTRIYLKNGQSFLVQSQLSAFNTKLQNAEQLRNIICEHGNNPTIAFMIHKRKKPVKKE